MTLQYIISNPAILGGKPCIKGTRISVELILEWLGNGGNIEKITEKYPQISSEAVYEALRYSASFLKNEIIVETQIVAA